MLPRDNEGYVTTGAKWAMVGVLAAGVGAASATALSLSHNSEPQPRCEAPYIYSEGICALDPYAAQAATEAPNYDTEPDDTIVEPTETPEATAEPTPDETEATEEPDEPEETRSALGTVALNPDTCKQWGDINHQPFEYGPDGAVSAIIDTRWRDGCKPDKNDGATVYQRANNDSKKLGTLANGSVVKIVGLECAQTPTPVPKAPSNGNKMPSALWLTIEVDGVKGKVTGYDTGYPDQQTLRSAGFIQKRAIAGQHGNC